MTTGQSLLLAATLTTIAVAPGPAHADDRVIQLGGGVAFDVLGDYDLGAHLHGPAARSDLGPGTLGVVVGAGVRVTPDLTLGAEGRLAVGGLVKTDERYFGARNDIGSTLSVDAKLVAGWTARRHGFWSAQLGADLGIERMIESTGSGAVHLEAIAGGPWVGVELGGHVSVQLRADLHVPVHAAITGQDSGDPTGVFFSGGVRVTYVIGVGPHATAR